NGMYNTITHIGAGNTSGPVITQAPDDNGMSRPKSITVTGACDGYSITTQPVSTTISSGAQTKLSVSAPNSTYQWYQVTGTGSSALSGQTGSTLTVSPTTTTGYWVRVKSGMCTIDSQIATVTVTACSANTTISGSSTVDAGGSGSASVPSQSGATYL